MADELRNLMNAIMRAEKEYGDRHEYRHVFGALREARYAATKISNNANYDSPGRQQALEAAGKAHVPEPADARNPTVPDSASDEGGTNGDSANGATGPGN